MVGVASTYLKVTQEVRVGVLKGLKEKVFETRLFRYKLRIKELSIKEIENQGETVNSDN